MRKTATPMAMIMAASTKIRAGVKVPPSLGSPPRSGGIGVPIPRPPEVHSPVEDKVGLSGSAQERQQRLELDLGLLQLGGRRRVANHPAAGVEVRHRSADQRAAERDAELAILGKVGPADPAGVPATVEALEGRNEGLGQVARLPAD